MEALIPFLDPAVLPGDSFEECDSAFLSKLRRRSQRSEEQFHRR